MDSKKKLVFIIVGAAIIFTAGFLFYPYLSVRALSVDILPDVLNNAELTDVYEEVPGQGIVEGLTAYYESENQNINVLFWKLESEAMAKDGQEQFLNDLKVEYDSMFDSVDWSVNHEFTVEEYKAYAVTFRAYLAGEYHDGGIMFAAVGEFFLVVQIVNYSGTPSFSELQTALGILINNVPGEAPPPPPPPPPSDDIEGEEAEEGEEEEKEVCGNNNCEYWVGENCDNCFDDCLYPFQSQGFCCYVGYKYIYAHNYHNEIYDLREALAGLIPEGTIIVDPDLDENNMPLRPTYICYDRGIKTGECIFNYDCPSGLCTTENWCVELRSEKPQEIKDEKIAEDIYKDATNYKEEYIEAYEKIQGGIGQTVIKDAKLDVKLEVQGSTSGKLPKVSQGDEIEVRLEITNDSDYQLGLIAGIFYPDSFNLEEKKYTVSFDWDGGLSSLIGSFKTKLINSKFIIMPSGSKIVVYSKVAPKEIGYLDVQGLVFFTTEKKYQDYDPGFLDEAPKSYQESEVSETILVEEKPCNWWPICL